MKKGGRLKGIDLILGRLRFADKSSMTDRNARVIIWTVLRQAALLSSILATRTSHYTRSATGVGTTGCDFVIVELAKQWSGTRGTRGRRCTYRVIRRMIWSSRAHSLRRVVWILRLNTKKSLHHLVPLLLPHLVNHRTRRSQLYKFAPPRPRPSPNLSQTNPRYEATLTSNDFLLQGSNKPGLLISQRLRQSKTQTTTKFRSEGVVRQTVSHNQRRWNPEATTEGPQSHNKAQNPPIWDLGFRRTSCLFIFPLLKSQGFNPSYAFLFLFFLYHFFHLCFLSQAKFLKSNHHGWA
jgi:hypothetical protein